MGAERRSLIMNDHEKANTAYHESGHAIVGRLVPDHDPVYKVSIIPRGRALGVTSYLPEQDRYSQSKQYLLSRISALFAGRVAEEIAFGEEAVTTGASNDIERATDIARRMVTRWGFSKRLPPMQFDQDQDQSQYLGGGHVATMPVSDKTTLIIDEEVTNIINYCYKRAYDLLTENRDILEAMKDALLKYETIDATQIDDLMNHAVHLRRVPHVVAVAEPLLVVVILRVSHLRLIATLTPLVLALLAPVLMPMQLQLHRPPQQRLLLQKLHHLRSRLQKLLLIIKARAPQASRAKQRKALLAMKRRTMVLSLVKNRKD